MTTYTVYSGNSGTEYGRHLTAEEAAEIVLTHDGAECRIAQDNEAALVNGATLWCLEGRKPNANRREWRQLYANRRGIMTYAASEEAAWPVLAAMVIKASWEHVPEVMTDADYNAMNLAQEEG